jgi:signal recognition particle receptor subunit alpha
MQNNGPLMNALSRLISINNPDLVVFIGEALAGNDAIDQLKTFNKSLLDLGAKGIDGIILSKFDTVDDKGK